MSAPPSVRSLPGTIAWDVARTAVGEVLVAVRLPAAAPSASGPAADGAEGRGAPTGPSDRTDEPRAVFASLCGEAGRSELEGRARSRGERIVRDSGGVAPFVRALVAYGEGGERELDLPLALEGTDFERAVWEELRRIPFGETRTYGEVAARVGRPGGARAVGRANGANPLPILVPCHRVVASDGPGGFTGGLATKLALLAHERAHVSARPGSQPGLPFGA